MINEYDVWFSNIDIKNKIKLILLKKFKNSRIIWNLTKKELINEKIDEKSINAILDNKYKLELEKYIKYIENKNIKLIMCNSIEYPNNLKYIENKPAFIYMRGNKEILNQSNIAIVGARNATTYGRFVARKIAKEIADRNINVVSGLAIGIDKYAHLGALDSNIGKTIAVLGTGVSDIEIYPKENMKVFERILENKGAIISEFKLGTKPEKSNFPIRNRIISGLSEKIIVVEAKEKSGSLITAYYGLEQGKDIFAVPGNITSEYSLGTNKLIEEGAFILKKVEDLF